MVVLAVAVAGLVSFIVSAALYAVPRVAAQVERTSTPRPGLALPVQMFSVLLRGLLAAAVLASLLVLADRHGAGAGAALGAIVALLPVAILSGAVVHENVPVPTALIHLSDWVLKLVVSGLVVGLFL